MGTNQGGLDGSESSAGTPDVNTWYHVWLIRRSDTGVVDVLFSESATAPAEWEEGFGTYSGSHVFVRTTVLSSSNSDAAVNFSAGTKDVFITKPAGRDNPRLLGLTDNRLLRSDGTAGNIQQSGITVDDSDNITGVKVNGATVPQFMRGHISGLTLSNNATDLVNDIDIAVGVACAADQSAMPATSCTATLSVPACRSPPIHPQSKRSWNRRAFTGSFPSPWASWGVSANGYRRIASHHRFCGGSFQQETREWRIKNARE